MPKVTVSKQGLETQAQAYHVHARPHVNVFMKVLLPRAVTNQTASKGELFIHSQNECSRPTFSAEATDHVWLLST